MARGITALTSGLKTFRRVDEETRGSDPASARALPRLICIAAFNYRFLQINMMCGISEGRSDSGFTPESDSPTILTSEPKQAGRKKINTFHHKNSPRICWDWRLFSDAHQATGGKHRVWCKRYLIISSSSVFMDQRDHGPAHAVSAGSQDRGS